uniref:Ras-associating domain-containing protein n=1 Tax=Zonotrichia albicollis TaxID=44394 RepID=A0A8D2QBB8_ZONAL
MYYLHFTEMLKTFLFHCDLHSREQLSSLLKNYNSYYSDQENLTPFIEGILSIFWGVRHPIRLKIQDEKQIPSFVTLKSTENVSFFPSKSHTLRSRREQELDCATLPRSSSDAAAVRRRTKLPTITRTEVETHRFSINGHFYNHETSVFTPAFGSETKIRINSQMRTRQVIEQLLRKFKVSLTAGKMWNSWARTVHGAECKKAPMDNFNPGGAALPRTARELRLA